MRYSRIPGTEERCDFDPNQGFVVFTEKEFTDIFGFPSKDPKFPKVEDRREFMIALAVKGQLPTHLEAAVKNLVENDDRWTEAYALVCDLPLPGEEGEWDETPEGFGL